MLPRVGDAREPRMTKVTEGTILRSLKACHVRCTLLTWRSRGRRVRPRRVRRGVLSSSRVGGPAGGPRVSQLQKCVGSDQVQPLLSSPVHAQAWQCAAHPAETEPVTSVTFLWSSEGLSDLKMWSEGP